MKREALLRVAQDIIAATECPMRESSNVVSIEMTPQRVHLSWYAMNDHGDIKIVDGDVAVERYSEAIA